MNLARLGFPLLRPLLQRLEAERAHRLTIGLLAGFGSTSPPPRNPRLGVEAFGLSFANPLGLAAGFDKNAEVPDAMLGLGFGFVEVGTATPRPQAGNPRPRLFRLTEDRAVINRMGFNNEGHGAVAARLARRRARGGIVGVNIGANKDAADRIGDYVQGIARFAGLSSFITVNISSPNTPGLRALQSRTELVTLLDRLNGTRAGASARPPMLLKIAPDLRDDELADIAEACGGGVVDGIIVSNTTISRPSLRSPLAREQGGLSGRPLFELSTLQLARMYRLTQGRIPLVGAGGISDAGTAWRKLRAGATLLQLYSALVFEGPGLVGEILGSLAEMTGVDAEAIAHQGLSGT
ncbi:MAG: quinone-dependent dihydroorotate dehydrogenase [Rhizobiales bacterium]|nr:quinone-dependent dihydroorotate dehydrogenase [Hyphomicrobiales bacterium]